VKPRTEGCRACGRSSRQEGIVERHVVCSCLECVWTLTNVVRGLPARNRDKSRFSSPRLSRRSSTGTILCQQRKPGRASCDAHPFCESQQINAGSSRKRRAQRSASPPLLSHRQHAGNQRKSAAACGWVNFRNTACVTQRGHNGKEISSVIGHA
jgi:hypothetical protein